MSKTTEKTSLLRININWCIKKIIEQEIKKWLYRWFIKKIIELCFFLSGCRRITSFEEKNIFPPTHIHIRIQTTPTHPLTHSTPILTHPSTPAPTHPPTHPLTHSLTYSFTRQTKNFPGGRGRRAYQRGEKKMLKWGALESKWFEGRRGLLFIRLRWWVGGRGEHPLFPPSPHIPSERVYFSG